jgi:hypothetical protein
VTVVVNHLIISVYEGEMKIILKLLLTNPLIQKTSQIKRHNYREIELQ